VNSDKTERMMAAIQSAAEAYESFNGKAAPFTSPVASYQRCAFVTDVLVGYINQHDVLGTGCVDAGFTEIVNLFAPNVGNGFVGSLKVFENFKERLGDPKAVGLTVTASLRPGLTYRHTLGSEAVSNVPTKDIKERVDVFVCYRQPEEDQWSRLKADLLVVLTEVDSMIEKLVERLHKAVEREAVIEEEGKTNWLQWSELCTKAGMHTPSARSVLKTKVKSGVTVAFSYNPEANGETTAAISGNTKACKQFMRELATKASDEFVALVSDYDESNNDNNVEF
jgi:hypothetical protein